jgi:hypothetical protein
MVADGTVVSGVDNQPTAIGNQKRRSIVASHVVRAQADSNHIGRIQRLLPEAALSGCTNLCGVVHEEIETAVLTTDVGEEICHCQIVCVIEHNSYSCPACARHEFGCFIY